MTSPGLGQPAVTDDNLRDDRAYGSVTRRASLEFVGRPSLGLVRGRRSLPARDPPDRRDECSPGPVLPRWPRSPNRKPKGSRPTRRRRSPRRRSSLLRRTRASSPSSASIRPGRRGRRRSTGSSSRTPCPSRSSSLRSRSSRSGIPESGPRYGILYPTTPARLRPGRQAMETLRPVSRGLGSPDRQEGGPGSRARSRAVIMPMAFSPDGAYFAHHVVKAPGGTDIYSIAETRRIARIDEEKGSISDGDRLRRTRPGRRRDVLQECLAGSGNFLKMTPCRQDHDPRDL